MDTTEAVKIAQAVRNESYPPTNPNVLLEAARIAYSEGRPRDLLAILGWTAQVVTNNSGLVGTDAQEMYSAGVSLHEAACRESDTPR